MALISKASLLMVPSTYEEGTLYNVLPSGNRAPDSTGQNSGYDQTRADFTFDRGSNAAATRIGSDGLIKKYRENKLLQSNQFDTTWTNINSTEASGQSGYDGSSNAWKLIAAGGNNDKIFQSVTQTGVVTLSVYAKAGNVNFIAFEYSGYAYFNLSTGAVGISGGIIDSNIEDVGGEWYRCSITVNISSTTNAQIYVTEANNSTNTSNGDFVYIQNAQVESGLVATDYLDSGATTAKAGVLIDLPRINYDANGENGSLILEPSRQQLLPYSEDFSNSAWGKANVTLTSNNTISPDGTQNASKLVATGSDGSLQDSISVTSGTTYTLSVYLKTVSGTLDMAISLGSPGFPQNEGEGGRYKNITVTNEWKRYTLTSTADASAATGIGVGGFNSFTTGEEVYVWGAQLEAGSYATSYIPNMGESGGVTRAADSCSVTGVSDVIGQTEGTLYAEFDFHAYAGAVDRGLFSIGEAGQGYVDAIYVSSYNNDLYLAVYVGGSVQANIAKSNISIGSHKIAIAYKANDFAYYLDGVQIGTDTSGSLPTPLNFIGIGNINGGFLGDFDTTKFTLFNERLSNSELATLTTL